MGTTKTYEQLSAENQELLWQLDEAKDTIDAIRNGHVDAIVVNGQAGHRIYSLKTADQTYRLFIEKMSEGAITLNREGVILSSNTRFATMVNLPLERVIGEPFAIFVDEDNLAEYQA